MGPIELMLAFTVATQTFALPQGLVSAVCFTESRHNVKAIHFNDGGEDSLGLCQVHLGTARDLGFKGTRKELSDPRTNIYYSAKYLNHQLSRYNGSIYKAVAAYNAGTYRLNDSGQVKNKQYVRKVFTAWAEGR